MLFNEFWYIGTFLSRDANGFHFVLRELGREWLACVGLGESERISRAKHPQQSPSLAPLAVHQYKSCGLVDSCVVSRRVASEWAENPLPHFSFGSFKLSDHDRFSQCRLSMEGGECTVVACGNGNTVPLVTPGAGKIWGEFVTINPDPSTSCKQPWKCTRCHPKYGKTSANVSRVGQHVCGKAGNVSGCPGVTIDDKKRFPRLLSSPLLAHPVPSSSTTTASATSNMRPSPSSLKRLRERTEEDVVREAFSEKERQAFVTNRLEDVVPNIKSMLMTAGDKATLDSSWTEAVAHAGIPPNAIDDDYVRHAIYKTSKIQVPPPPPPLPPPPTPLPSDSFVTSGVIWSVLLEVNATRSARRWRSHRWLNTGGSAPFCCAARLIILFGRGGTFQ